MKQTMVLVLTATVLCVNGCDKKAKTEPQAGKKTEQDQGNPLNQRSPAGVVNTGGGNAAAMAVRRGVEIQRHQGDLMNIGIFYQQYVTENGKAPAKLEDFIEYIKKDSPSIATALKDKTFTLILLANLPQMTCWRTRPSRIPMAAVAS